MLSILPTDVVPFILTVSPSFSGALTVDRVVAADVLSLSCPEDDGSSFLRFFLFSFLLRICAILRAILSSSACLSISEMPSLKSFRLSRSFFVSSFSACFSRISRMTFSIFLLLSLNSSSALSLALASTSLRLFARSLISDSYLAIVCSICFSR